MSYGPTHQFCPKCSAMLPPQLMECPRCGTDLMQTTGTISGKEIFQITGVVLLITAVPLILMLVIAGICIATAR